MRKLIDVINDIAKLNSKERTVQEEMKYNNLFAELIIEDEVDTYVETREGIRPSKVTTNYFKHKQLNTILNKNICKYNNTPYRYKLTEDDIFCIMLDIIMKLNADFDFSKGEGGLVNYISLLTEKRCIDEFNKINEVYNKNNFQNYSFDDYIEECTENGIDLDKNLQSTDTYSWDSKDKSYRLTKQQRIMREIKSYEYLTTNQKNKILKLIQAMEDGEYTIVDCCADSILDNETKTYKYKDNYFSLRLNEMKEVLFPYRKGNANKDIYQFLDSVNNRLNFYLAEKGYNIADCNLNQAM